MDLLEQVESATTIAVVPPAPTTAAAGQPAAIAADPQQPEGPPDGQPEQEQPQSPDWCVCTNCTMMSTPVEDRCCGFAPEHCLSRYPVGLL